MYNNIPACKRLQIAESELSLTESKINELATLLNRAKDEKATADRQHQSELKRGREVSEHTRQHEDGASVALVVLPSNRTVP